MIMLLPWLCCYHGYFYINISRDLIGLHTDQSPVALQPARFLIYQYILPCVCSQRMETSVTDVYAAGDIVQFPLFIADDQPTNIQHWQMACQHGKVTTHIEQQILVWVSAC